MLPHFWKGLLPWSSIHGEAVIVLGQGARFGLSLSWLQLLPKAQNHTGQFLLAWAVPSFGLFMAGEAKSAAGKQEMGVWLGEPTQHMLIPEHLQLTQKPSVPFECFSWIPLDSQ